MCLIVGDLSTLRTEIGSPFGKGLWLVQVRNLEFILLDPVILRFYSKETIHVEDSHTLIMTIKNRKH